MGILPMNSAFRLTDNMAMASRARCPCHNITHYSLFIIHCGTAAPLHESPSNYNVHIIALQHAACPARPLNMGFSYPIFSASPH
jgi:hypothetical protein